MSRECENSAPWTQLGRAVIFHLLAALRVGVMQMFTPISLVLACMNIQVAQAAACMGHRASSPVLRNVRCCCLGMLHSNCIAPSTVGAVRRSERLRLL